jgi:hypothetical protein
MSIIKFSWLVAEPYPSEKYEFVSWDDENPNIWKVIIFMFQTPNQKFSVYSRMISSFPPSISPRPYGARLEPSALWAPDL